MRSKGTLSAIAAATMLMANAIPAFAQLPSSTLSVNSTASCVRSGADIPVTLVLSNASNASTVQATVTYDPTVLEVPTKPVIGASFPLPFRNETDPVRGRIELSASNSNAVNGNADFATITFRALKSGATQIGFDQNASLVLTTAAENTNVLGTVTPLSLPSCDPSSTNSNAAFGNSNSNGSTWNANTNGFVNVASPTPVPVGFPGGTQCSVASGFGATAQGNGIVLTWKSEDPRLTHFVVHYGRTPGTFDTTFVANNANTLRDGPNFRLTLENVAPGKTYHLAVSTVGNCAESPKTPTVSVQTMSYGTMGGGQSGNVGNSGGGSSTGSSTGGGGHSGGYTYGGYGQDGFGTTGSTSVVNNGLTTKGQRFNSTFRGAAPYTGPKEAILVAILSALAIGGAWAWRRGLA